VKLQQDADAAEKAGRFDRAIDALKLLVEENPRDWISVNRIGDLYAKLANTKAANEEYVKVALFLAAHGF
jgi:Flp pilus assembly protein TadD